MAEAPKIVVRSMQEAFTAGGRLALLGVREGFAMAPPQTFTTAEVIEVLDKLLSDKVLEDVKLEEVG